MHKDNTGQYWASSKCVATDACKMLSYTAYLVIGDVLLLVTNTFVLKYSFGCTMLIPVGLVSICLSHGTVPHSISGRQAWRISSEDRCTAHSLVDRQARVQHTARGDRGQARLGRLATGENGGVADSPVT